MGFGRAAEEIGQLLEEAGSKGQDRLHRRASRVHSAAQRAQVRKHKLTTKSGRDRWVAHLRTNVPQSRPLP